MKSIPEDHVFKGSDSQRIYWLVIVRKTADKCRLNTNQ